MCRSAGCMDVCWMCYPPSWCCQAAMAARCICWAPQNTGCCGWRPVDNTFVHCSRDRQQSTTPCLFTARPGCLQEGGSERERAGRRYPSSQRPADSARPAEGPLQRDGADHQQPLRGHRPGLCRQGGHQVLHRQPEPAGQVSGGGIWFVWDAAWEGLARAADCDPSSPSLFTVARACQEVFSLPTLTLKPLPQRLQV